jgi:hypothetical protein
MRLTLF